MSEQKEPMSREQALPQAGFIIGLLRDRGYEEAEALQFLLDREDHLTDAAQQIEYFHYAAHMGYTLLDAYQVAHIALHPPKSREPKEVEKP